MLPPLTFHRSFRQRGLVARHLPALVLGVGLLTVLLMVLEARETEDALAQTEFEHMAQRISRDFESRLAGYQQLAHSASGLLDVGVELSPAQWAAYVEGLPGTRHAAGFQGLGIAFRQAGPAGVDRFPLASLVPLSDVNQRALGFDLASEPVRRAAIDMARDRGAPTFSAPLALINAESDRPPGLLVVAPFYRNGRPEHMPDRRRELAGVVLVGLRADLLLQALRDDPESSMLALRLVDQASGQPLGEGGLADPRRRFAARHEIMAGGRAWTLEYAATPRFVERLDRHVSTLAGAIGLIVSLLLAAGVSHLSDRRQRARRQDLETYREFLLRILDTLPEAIVVKAADETILIANRAYGEWVGQPVDQLAGRRAHEFFPPEVADASVSLEREILADGAPRQIELLIPDRRRGGELRNVVVRKMAGRGLRGEPLVVGIHQDVTDVRRSEARFRHLTELSSDWYWEQDADLHFTMVSGLEGSGRMPPQEVIGKYRWDLPIEWDAAQWETHWRLLTARQPFRELEYPVRGVDGELRWFSISGEPVFDGQGRFAGYRGIGRNVTARHRAEEELRRHRDHLAELVAERTIDLLRAKEAAEEGSRVKSEFLANMSHELRTPLHAILSFARLGLDRSAQPSGQERAGHYFTRILEAGERLLTLISDLLDMSKMEAGKMHYDIRPCDLVQLIHDMAFEFEAMAEERRVSLELPPAGRPAPARLDAHRFAQVLRNILSNALKFSPQGGRVTVALEEAQMPGGRRASDGEDAIPAWCLSVTDEGMGIPEGELESVFGKFNQSSATRSGAGGTGLGLAICREIVSAHRGRIAVRNRPEGGAVFEILLPR